MKKRFFWISPIIFGLIIISAFYLRSESWLETTVRRPLQKDAADYFYYAHNLRHSQTYSRQAVNASDPATRIAPDAVRNPGYPLFLALLIDGPPSRQLAEKITFWQMIISTLTVVAACFLLRCLLPPAWAYSAAALIALSPHLIVFNSYILTETLFCSMLVFFGLLLCRLARHPSIWLSFLIGAVMAFATLIRPSLQFFPVVMAILLWLTFGRQTGTKLFLFACLGFVLIVSPWYIRNLLTLNKASDKSLMINFLHHGMYPDFKYQQKAETYGRPYKYDPRSDEFTKDLSSLTAEITKRFVADPAVHLKWYLLGKPVTFWSWDTIQGHGDMYVYYVPQSPFKNRSLFRWIQKLMKFLHDPLVLLAVIGSLVVWIAPGLVADNPTRLFVVRFMSALLLYFTALHMVGAPFPRYSVPLRPFQYAMGLYALYTIATFKMNVAVSSKPAEP